MSNELVKADAATAYKTAMTKYATAWVQDLLPPERVREAVGRMSVAFRAAALVNPALYSVEPQFIAEAIALSASTGLMPGGVMPDCYLIPRKKKVRFPDGSWGEVQTVQWMASFRGLVKIASRASAHDIEAHAVHAGDVFDWEEGLHPDLKHKPVADDRTWDTLTHVYVVAFPVAGGRPKFRVLDRRGIEDRRARSDAWKRGEQSWDGRPPKRDSPWHTDALAMALKTGLRYAISRGIVVVDDLVSTALQAEAKADVVDAQDLLVTQPMVLDTPPQRALVERQVPVTADDAIDAALGEPEPEPEPEVRTPPPEPEPKVDPIVEALLAKVAAAEEGLKPEQIKATRVKCGAQKTGVKSKPETLQRLLDGYAALARKPVEVPAEPAVVEEQPGPADKDDDLYLDRVVGLARELEGPVRIELQKEVFQRPLTGSSDLMKQEPYLRTAYLQRLELAVASLQAADG